MDNKDLEAIKGSVNFAQKTKLPGIHVHRQENWMGRSARKGGCLLPGFLSTLTFYTPEVISR